MKCWFWCGGSFWQVLGWFWELIWKANHAHHLSKWTPKWGKMVSSVGFEHPPSRGAYTPGVQDQGNFIIIHSYQEGAKFWTNGVLPRVCVSKVQKKMNWCWCGIAILPNLWGSHAQENSLDSLRLVLKLRSNLESKSNVRLGVLWTPSFKDPNTSVNPTLMKPCVLRIFGSFEWVFRCEHEFIRKVKAFGGYKEKCS